MLDTYWITSIKKPSYYNDISNQLEPNLKSIKYNERMSCECYDWYFNIQNNAIALDIEGSKSKNFDTVVSEWYIKDCFRQYKQVYILNDNLYKRLILTKNINEISFEVLKKLPFNSFYIDSDSCNIYEQGYKVNGLFVSIENYTINGVLYNNLMLILRINKELIPLRIDLLKSQSIEQAINNTWSNGTYFNNDSLKKVFIDFFQVVLYMCCDKTDIIKVVQHKPNYKKGKKIKSKTNPITYSRLGFTIGKTFSNTETKYVSVENSNSNTKGSPKSPHFRRPHWAIYHVGKDRAETILKWIDLIFVNNYSSKDEDNKPITLHNMR